MFLNLSGRNHYISLNEPVRQQIDNILEDLCTSFDNFSFSANGKVLSSFEDLPSMTTIRAMVPLLGGKGGYGAKLKTEGGKKVRPNDNMFSRDTQGQRTVYATMEKEFKQFVVKKMEEDEKVAREREQFKIMENTLKEGQSFMKLDRAYKKEIEETEKNLMESIMIGKQRAMERKREKEEQSHEKKETQNCEQKVQKVEVIEENKESQASEEGSEQKKEEQTVKRSLPQEFKSQPEKQPTKLIKTESVKPVFLSAQQRFKALFKK